MSYSFIANTPNFVTLCSGAKGPMVQVPHEPSLILDAPYRHTVGTVVGVRENTTVAIVQETVPSIGTGKRRRPPVTVAANVDEAPDVEPTAARPCRETRNVCRTRVGTIPTPGCQLGRRALQCASSYTPPS